MYQTIREQKLVEGRILKNFEIIDGDFSKLRLLREEHVSFLEECLNSLPREFQSLSSSQPWILYWILHSLELLGVEIDSRNLDYAIEYISRCQIKTGGFAGAPGQAPHIGNTYAAVCALSILAKMDPKAYEVIDRVALKQFILRCKNRDGSYKNAIDNETDLRAMYCAIASAKMCHILTPDMCTGTAEYIVKCQNYDGGFGAVPGAESHAGYAFCAAATLDMLDVNTILFNKHMLLRWIAHRQMMNEGGFQGRTFKLVDSCYSYWIGSIFYIMYGDEFVDDAGQINIPRHILSRSALQMYILANCQNETGGFIDKPGKHTDIYHTCYALSGLSLSQTHPDIEADKFNVTNRTGDILVRCNPTFNLCHDTLKNLLIYFSNKNEI